MDNFKMNLNTAIPY